MGNRSFKITGPTKPTDIVRMPDGKFTRGVQMAPPQIVKQAHDTGVEVLNVIGEHAAVEHPRPKGTTSTVGEEIPWSAVGNSFSESGKLPYKLNA